MANKVAADIFLLLGLIAQALAAESLARGWGDQIQWKAYNEGLEDAKSSNKPVMLLIHKTWCGACKALKPAFATSKEITTLSKYFVMINVEDEEEPKDEKFLVDGRYIPRIFFLDSQGEVMKDVYNKNGRHKETKFYYGKTSEIAASMRHVVRKSVKDFDEADLEPAAEEKPQKSTERPKSKLAKGFGDYINWKTYEDGLAEAKENDKMMVLIIHKTWCGSCKALKPKLASHKEFDEMSEKFVMVNTEDDEEPKGSQFIVDGEYVPRILFLDSNGKVDKSIWNEGTKHPHVKFYYANGQEIVTAMKRALAKKETGKLPEAKAETTKETKQKDEENKDPWWKRTDEEKGNDRGFGSHIRWMTYSEGVEESKKRNKMMMLIIHKTWCTSCKALKPKLANHKGFGELSKQFVMVNVEDDEEPKGAQFNIDGSYVPRIFFITPKGDVAEDLWNEDTKYPHVKYYYHSADELVDVMKKALKATKAPVPDNGWGTSIDWVSLDEGFEIAAQSKKPLMLIIHKSWCSACKGMKKKFLKSEEVQGESKNFAMVNILDDNSETDNKWQVDGGYVPRFFFIDPFTRKIMEQFRNDDPEFKDFKYAWDSPKKLASMMKKVSDAGVDKGAVPHGGFGEHIKWMALQDGLKEAKAKRKPVMLILHKSWCQLTQALKPKFAESKQIAELSNSFVMINLEDDEIPKDSKYSIDGSYVPRILFLDSNGEVKKDIVNEDSTLKDAKFYYHKAEEIVKAMKKVEPEKVELDRGFGKGIDWMTYEEGLEESKSSKKPMMLIIHKTWCGACRALKPDIAKSKKIHELSKEFVMVNVENDEEPNEEQFNVDGKYIPRIFFLDSDGKVHNDLHNTDLQYLKFKYTYADPELLEESMERAIKKLKPKDSLGRGLGKNINWQTFEEGKRIAAESWKPLMLVIHKSWCSACQTFKPKFAGSKKIAALSKDLVMVNVEDEFDDSENYDLDGEYIPRIFFLDPNGRIMEDIYNSGTIYKENKYYYWEPNSVVQSMEKAVDKVLAMSKTQKDEL